MRGAIPLHIAGVWYIYQYDQIQECTYRILQPHFWCDQVFEEILCLVVTSIWINVGSVEKSNILIDCRRTNKLINTSWKGVVLLILHEWFHISNQFLVNFSEYYDPRIYWFSPLNHSFCFGARYKGRFHCWSQYWIPFTLPRLFWSTSIDFFHLFSFIYVVVGVHGRIMTVITHDEAEKMKNSKLRFSRLVDIKEKDMRDLVEYTLAFGYESEIVS